MLKNKICNETQRNTKGKNPVDISKQKQKPRNYMYTTTELIAFKNHPLKLIPKIPSMC